MVEDEAVIMNSSRKRKRNQETQPAKDAKHGRTIFETVDRNEEDDKRNDLATRQTDDANLDSRQTDDANLDSRQTDEAYWNEPVITDYLCNRVKVVHFECSMEEETSIDESSRSLRYTTPIFSASATVRIAPLTDKEKWKVGWIQACDANTTHNTYGAAGYATWEIDVVGMMCNDSDGRHYPWGAKNEFTTFKGPAAQYQSKTLRTEDSPEGRISWFNPARPTRSATLTNISSRQSFNVWLVAWCVTTNKAYILKNVHWGISVNIDVDPKLPRGHRAKLVGDHTPVQPTECVNVPIPRCALRPPNTNSALMLVWRPTCGPPTCIIRPAWVTEHVPYCVSRLCGL